MEIKKVGVVGCGLMGSGIAQVCAQSGYQVVVSEINQELLNKGLASINSFLMKSVDRGKISQQDRESILARIKGTTSYKDFSSCDLVIEAVTENMELKKNAFAELDRICPSHTILASNTSCLSILDLAMATNRPERVLGLHFASPAPVAPVLEIVRSIATSDETLTIARHFGESLSKAVVNAQDTPGFIGNRLLIPYLLDAIRMLETGITKEDIDTCIRLGLNHPMGPITLADFIGLDTLYFIANSMYDEFKDYRFAVPPLLRKMVTAGWLGRKTGKGFYDYA